MSACPPTQTSIVDATPSIGSLTRVATPSCTDVPTGRGDIPRLTARTLPVVHNLRMHVPCSRILRHPVDCRASRREHTQDGMGNRQLATRLVCLLVDPTHDLFRIAVVAGADILDCADGNLVAPLIVLASRQT